MKLGPYKIGFRAGALVVPAIFFSYGLYQYLNVRSLPDREINLVLIQPVFILMVIFTAWVICQNLRIRRVGNMDPAPETEAPAGKKADIKKYAFFILLVLLYLSLMPYIGFIICNLVFLTACMLLLGVKRLKLLLLLPAGATFGVYLLFAFWMQLPLPRGILSFLP